MISLKICRLRFQVHFSFIMLFILLFLLNSGKLALISALSSLLHEGAHAYAARKLGYTPSVISAGLFGGVLHLEEGYIEPELALLIHSAGPLLNLGIAMVSYCAILITGFNFLYPVLIANLVLAIFNLLPLYPLDGGKLISIYLTEFFNPKISYLITKILSMLFIIILFLLGLYLVQYSLVNLIICALALNLYFAGRENYRYSYNRLRGIYANLKEEKNYDDKRSLG